MKISSKTFTILAAGLLVGEALAGESARTLISAACNAENTALASNQDLSNAALRVETECQAPVSGARAAAAIDYDDCPAAVDYLAACEAAGGQQYKYDVSMSCSQEGGANAATISASNVPECVGNSCELDALEAKYGEDGKVFENAEKDLQEFGFTCSITGGSSAPVDPVPPSSAPPPVDAPTADAPTADAPTADAPTADEPTAAPVPNADDPTSEPLPDIPTDTSDAGGAFWVVNIAVLIGCHLLAANAPHHYI